MKRFLHLQLHTTGGICAGIWTILALFSHKISTTSVRIVAETQSYPTVAETMLTQTGEVNADLNKSTQILILSTDVFKHWMETKRGVKNTGDVNEVSRIQEMIRLNEVSRIQEMIFSFLTTGSVFTLQ